MILVAAIAMQPMVGQAYGQEQTTWLVTYEVRLASPSANATYVPGPMTILSSVTLWGNGFSGSFLLQGNLSDALNVTGTTQIQANYPPNYVRMDYLWVDKPVYLVSLLSFQPSGTYDWRFTKAGKGYTFSLAPRSYALFSPVGNEADYSSIRATINETSKQVYVDVKLMLAPATVVPISFSGSSPLMSQITLNTPTAFVLSADNSIAIVPPWLDVIALTGSYAVYLPALPTTTRLDIPFSLDLNISKADQVSAGTRLVGQLMTTANDWLGQDESFFRNALLDDPETMGRISEAKNELQHAVQSEATSDEATFGFLAANALKLTAEVRQERNDATFSATYFTAPIVICFLLIAAAMVGHLVFNGKPKYIAVIFLAALAASFACHPALRIYALSMEMDVKILPSIVVTAVLVGGVGYIVLRRKGVQTVYGLAFSTSMRLIKARKLRGFLSLLAVVVVAASVVPNITLTGTSPVLTSQSGAGTTRFASWAFATWTVRVVSSSSESQTAGLRPLNPGEASYLASAADLENWTSLSAVKGELDANGKVINGSFIVADIAKLVDLLGVHVGTPTANLSRGILLVYGAGPGPVPSTGSVAVNGKPLKVAGYVSGDSLLAPDNKTLGDLLLSTPILRGGLSLSGASAAVIGGPFLGVIDEQSALELGLAATELGVVGNLRANSVDQVAGGLQSLVLANRNWLTFTQPEMQMYIEAVFTYRFDISAGPSATSVYATLPVTIAAGNWSAQLILTVIGGLIVMNVVINSVVERRREATAFSSLGASPSFVTNLFIAEGITLGALGGCIGYAIGYAVSAWLGVSSPAVKAESYTLTPLILVLLLSMLMTSLGSILPAKSAILQIVPSREILKRQVGEIRFDPSGDALINVPMRLKTWEWSRFSEFMQKLVSPPTTSYAYGLWIMEHNKVNSVDRLVVDYKASEGRLAERSVTYDVDVRPITMGEFDGVELKVSGNPEWTDGHRMLLKEMLYVLKDRLIRYTVDRTQIKETPEEEIQEIRAQLARMRSERENLSKSLMLLDRGILALKEKEAELREKTRNAGAP